MAKQRLQKVLAAAGVDSRRNIEQMVLQGRISVNGKVMTKLPILITPGKDRIKVDDEPIKLNVDHNDKPTERVYVLLNKPKDIYSTNVAQGEQVRAIDLLPPNFPRVFPVGRLDAESKGLLLLTNDGELTNRLTHPRYGVIKTYRASVDGQITPEALLKLEHGVWLGDTRTGHGFKTAHSRLKIIKRTRDRTMLEITIREGRNRQVRRMFAAAGHKVRELTRVRMGPLTLEGLPPGHFRMLLAREVRALKALGEKKPITPLPAQPMDD